MGSTSLISAGRSRQQETKSRRFLECTEDNFLTQLSEESTSKDTLLDLIPANKEELVREVKAGANLNCRDHEM